MDRLTFLRREYNALWTEVAVINKKFSQVSHNGETQYLKLKKAALIEKLNHLEQGIKELEAYNRPA